MRRTISVTKAVAKELLRPSHGVLDFSRRSIALHCNTRILECAAALRHTKEENERDRNADDVHNHRNARDEGPNEPFWFVAGNGHISDHKVTCSANANTFERDEDLGADRGVDE